MFEQVKIGVALGAGGARGLAHLGVLEGLEAAGIKISYLAGTSIGALIGAAYAVSGSAAELQQRFLAFLDSDLFKDSGLSLIAEAVKDKPETVSQRIETWLKKAYLQAKVITKTEVMDSQLFRKIIEYFIPNIRIEDLPQPFWAMGADLRTGRGVVFKTGPLRAAVYASAAIPGAVKPLSLDDYLIVDGGVLNMVPVVPVIHMGAEVVLAVDVEKALINQEDYSSAFELLFRVEDIQNYYIKEMHVRLADLILRPEVGHVHWADFKRAPELIRLGKDEVLRRLEEVQELARRRKMPWTRRRCLPSLPLQDWIVV
ncbi:MAG: patatin-like phospholipase family protein [Pseudomonadota bacterium]